MSRSGWSVAIVGATGNVGRKLLDVLEARRFPVSELTLLASPRSVGHKVVYRGRVNTVRDLATEDFKNIDIVLASAGATVSREFVPRAKAAGAVVIDNSSAFRMDEDVPLVVPECNGDDLAKHQGLIANPNCSTAQMVVALKPIHTAAGIERLTISTYQSVSGTGKNAIDECVNQTRAALVGVCEGELPTVTDPADAKVYPHPIAFNLIPQIDHFTPNGYTKEEMKMVNETRKILGDASMRITATCVRVPVIFCHSESVNVETKRQISVDDVRSLLSKAPGLVMVDDPATLTYPTPLYAAGRHETYVGRLRQDISNPKALEMFIVSDNLMKGAALNAVQIAEELVARGLLRK